MLKKKSILITVLIIIIIMCNSVFAFGGEFEDLVGDTDEQNYTYEEIEGEAARTALINQDSAIEVAKTNQTTCIYTALIIGGSLIISAALKRGKKERAK